MPHLPTLIAAALVRWSHSPQHHRMQTVPSTTILGLLGTPHGRRRHHRYAKSILAAASCSSFQHHHPCHRRSGWPTWHSIRRSRWPTRIWCYRSPPMAGRARQSDCDAPNNHAWPHPPGSSLPLASNRTGIYVAYPRDCGVPQRSSAAAARRYPLRRPLAPESQSGNKAGHHAGSGTRACGGPEGDSASPCTPSTGMWVSWRRWWTRSFIRCCGTCRPGSSRPMLKERR